MMVLKGASIGDAIARVRAEGWEIVRLYVVQGPEDMLRGIGGSEAPLAALPRPCHASTVDGVEVLWHRVRHHHRKGGRCKWYTVDGQRVQGRLEQRYATALSRIGVRWVAHHKRTFLWWDADGRAHWYAPDFFLPDENCYVEIKGFMAPEAADKIRRVREQHQDLDLRVLFEADVSAVEREAAKHGAAQ